MLAYVGLDHHSCSKGVLIERFTTVLWISYSFSGRISVRSMGDLVQDCCLSLGSEPPHLAGMYLVRPW